MSEFFASPFFGLTLSMASFVFFAKISRKIGSPLVNPVLASVIFIIFILTFFNIPLQDYNKGGSLITMLLFPVMTAVAYSIYRQKTILKQYFSSVVIGCFFGSAVSILSIIGMCKLFGLNEVLTNTLVPKSATAPIAIEISTFLGGLPAVTIAAVTITGIMGSVLAPIMIKLFGIKDKVAAGVGIGACSHGVGTSKAMEIGEVEGATSGIAIGIAGIFNVLLAMLLK